ncbi:MAG: dTDP-4-dehydrorhamnose reductase [Planctomycetota bacterium]
MTNATGTVLVTGAAGMLGSQLLAVADERFRAIGTDLVDAREGAPGVAEPGVDLADPRAAAQLFEKLGDELAGVIHAAAYTAVDKAESEPELCERVNARAPEVLARACRERGLPLVLVSTDFVFDGTATRPYRPDDATGPLGVYGRTKYEGERRAGEAHPDGLRVVRTQWLYGPRGGHFPGTILRLAGERGRLSIVADQTGAPTSTLELAPALWDVLAGADAGIWHAACEGTTTWYGFARAAIELGGDERQRACELVPCTTQEYPTAAPRPAYSVLDSSALTALRGRSLAPWDVALTDFFEHERRAPRAADTRGERA